MAAETKAKLIPSRKLNFRQCTRYRQRHGNSDDYRQLKSIATAIRNSRSSPTTSDNGSRQPTMSSTINDEYASTTYDNRKPIYLLAIRSLAFTFKMADNIDSQTTIKQH